MDVIAYTYQAAIWCPACVMRTHVALQKGQTAEARLDQASYFFGVNRKDETTFDDEHFPKVVLRGMLEGFVHCDNCTDCIDHDLRECWPEPDHAAYPHAPGRLHDCPACEAKCHCVAGETECVFDGEHNAV